MKTLYVRINQRKEAERFYRCGIEFGRGWKKASDLDDATAQRLEEEQMLEVTATHPAELEDEAQAGDSANAIDPGAGSPVPPADAPEAVIEETADMVETPVPVSFIAAAEAVEASQAAEAAADEAAAGQPAAAKPSAKKKAK